jgi:guanylate kinase
VVNDDLTRAYCEVRTIVAAERLRARRIQAGVGQLVERLLAE